jgi:catechol 2,3-dioxygenase-like lactoylglutathione lyase family enzyme
MMIEALDHVQVAMPAKREAEARGFYSGLLGLEELGKPVTPASRDGAWFALPDGRQLHLGVEEPFRASRKAHPAFVVGSLDELARRLEEAGHLVRWDDGLASRRRFYGEDPFGNRLEFMESLKACNPMPPSHVPI